VTCTSVPRRTGRSFLPANQPRCRGRGGARGARLTVVLKGNKKRPSGSRSRRQASLRARIPKPLGVTGSSRPSSQPRPPHRRPISPSRASQPPACQPRHRAAATPPGTSPQPPRKFSGQRDRRGDQASFVSGPAAQLRTVAAEPGVRRCHVCSAFARMSRYGTVSAVTRRPRISKVAAYSGTSRHVPALAGTG
jgi:hypothetical protein